MDITTHGRAWFLPKVLRSSQACTEDYAATFESEPKTIRFDQWNLTTSSDVSYV